MNRETAAALWVDKYSPRSTHEIILSNRDVLVRLVGWLRGWSAASGRRPTAALVSGPSGVGKTTAVDLAVAEAGLTRLEFNASDARSKKTLQEDVSDSIRNHSITSFVVGSSPDKTKMMALVMDEVDGMSAGDRGGIQELIQMIKKTKVPIVCICNDRMNQKVRALATHCLDLRFPKPTSQQVANRLLEISRAERVPLTPDGAQRLAAAADGDIRQAIHSLYFQSLGGLGGGAAQPCPNTKDVEVKVFDSVPRLLNYVGLKAEQKLGFYYADSDMLPLMVQENYIHTKPRLACAASGGSRTHMSLISKAADDISAADVVNRSMRKGGRWDLMDEHAFLSSVMPSYSVQGPLVDRLAFPAWLGKNSTSTKNARLLRELQMHMRLATGGASSADVNLDYVPRLARRLTEPLSKSGTSAVGEVIDLMDGYELSREDCDSVLEVWGLRPPLIAPAVKSSFTRRCNAGSRRLLSSAGASRVKRVPSDAPSPDGDGQDEGSEGEDGDDRLVKKVVVPKRRKTAK